jgi:uncharacterized protein YbaR (Trm112 family)
MNCQRVENYIRYLIECPECGTVLQVDEKGDPSVDVSPAAYCPQCGLDYPLAWKEDRFVPVLLSTSNLDSLIQA